MNILSVVVLSALALAPAQAKTLVEKAYVCIPQGGRRHKDRRSPCKGGMG